MTGVDSRSLEEALRNSSQAALLAYFERRASDRADAADMLGELMLQAWRRTEALPDEPERQRMWLFTMARHVLANHRRSARNRHALVEKVAGRTSRSGRRRASARAADVRDAVRRLPEQQRELVMLVHWDRFTIVDAAELTGTNPSTARSRYAAARIALQEALGEAIGS